MAIGVRGFNPIWLLDDLTGKLFDDTFWFYVLENTIPYIPETVYHDPELTIPWTNPIRFLANGTLPVDIWFDPHKVYRLEFRQNIGLLPPSQNDPLIYEVNDYVPGSGSITPTPVVGLTSENQITNPQFAIINFASPLTITVAGSYELAPGWFLDLAGAGTATISRVPLTSANANSSNAPYALHLVLSGWTPDSVILRQRFQQNGVLWSGKIVASAVTARTGSGFQTLTANLVNSNSSMTVNVLSAPTVTGAFTEFTGHGLVPASGNTDIPPAAWIEYQLLLANSNDIYLTSFQLTVSDTEVEPEFIQDTVDRQIDHTFHNYKESLLREQKNSVLTGWDFGLNPWQFHTTAVTNLATFGYIADQTIVFTQPYAATATGNAISTARGSFGENYGFKVAAVAAANQFALVQYIDPTTIRTGWGKTFSSMVKLFATLQTTTLGVKMRLIHRASLPSAIAQNEPIATWNANGEPNFTGGWTPLAPPNDPVYLITNGDNTLLFEGFDLPESTNAAMTLGIVIYTTASMVQTGTPDNMVFHSVSLVQNDFAIEVPSLTFDETLRQCQYYYQKSFLVGTVPIQNAGANTGESYGMQGNNISSCGPIIRFATPMRGVPMVAGVANVVTYNPQAANIEIHDVSGGGNWTSTVHSTPTAQGFYTAGSPAAAAAGSVCSIHWTASALLGNNL